MTTAKEEAGAPTRTLLPAITPPNNDAVWEKDSLRETAALSLIEKAVTAVVGTKAARNHSKGRVMVVKEEGGGKARTSAM